MAQLVLFDENVNPSDRRLGPQASDRCDAARRGYHSTTEGRIAQGSRSRLSRAPDHMEPGALNITITESGPISVVHLEGELDLATAPELSEALNGVPGSRCRVILDITDLQFIDSTGLRLVVVEHGRSTMEGFEFVIAGANADIRGRCEPLGST